VRSWRSSFQDSEEQEAHAGNDFAVAIDETAF
jgi:hypothetical protein